MKVFLCVLFFMLGGQLEATVTEIIDRVKARAQATSSDALVILRHGSPLLDYRSGIECSDVDSQEMSKPLIGLAIALLLDEGRLPCVDIAMHTYYPQWNEEPFCQITLRHLLGNCSGLDFYADRGFLSMAEREISSAKLLHLPGARYYQNPKGIALLADLVKRCSGKELSQYLYDKLFRPLGIMNVSWHNNCAKPPLPQFTMDAMDLAKIGLLISYNGIWCGQQLISTRRLKEMLSPSQSFDPFFGFQWWLEYYDIAAWWDESLLQEYSQAGISCALIAKLRALQGRVIHFSGQIYGSKIVKLRGCDLIHDFDGGAALVRLLEETHCLGLPLARFTVGKLKMASAHGRGGQHLIVMPQQGLVAVRQRHITDTSADCGDEFDDLSDLLEEISIACDCYSD